MNFTIKIKLQIGQCPYALASSGRRMDIMEKCCQLPVATKHFIITNINWKLYEY